MLTVKWGTEHFKHYLRGRHFAVETDHKALISVFNRHRAHKEYSARLTRWQMRLLPFDFTVFYTPGSRMGITNYLSRDPAFKAPPPKHESSLVIAIIKQLNIQKSLSLIERATKTEILSSKQEGENKRPTPLLRNSQTSPKARQQSES